MRYGPCDDPNCPHKDNMEAAHREVERLRDALEQQAQRHEREHRMLKAQLKHIVEKAAHIEALRPIILKIDPAYIPCKEGDDG